MSETMIIGFLAKFSLLGLGKIRIPVDFDPSHLPVGQITRNLGYSASHWLSWPIRGPGKSRPVDS